MPVLNAICPRCRSVVDTGLSADEQSIKNCQELRVLVLCDDCQEYHKMLVRDLYLTRSQKEMAV